MTAASGSAARSRRYRYLTFASVFANAAPRWRRHGRRHKPTASNRRARALGDFPPKENERTVNPRKTERVHSERQATGCQVSRNVTFERSRKLDAVLAAYAQTAP